MKVAVLDTCCLINLYASRQMKTLILTGLEKAIIPKQVARESLFIRQPRDDDLKQLIPFKIDLKNLCEDISLEVIDFNSDKELEQFVHLATILDDGEAACMAIASSRGLLLATDDRKAIAIAKDLNVEVMTTPEILISWIRTMSPSPQEIANVIFNIEQYGRFKPHHTSPYAKWWRDNGLCNQQNV